MKRSDMVDFIESALAFEGDFNLESNKVKAAWLLTVLEKKGMRPPSVDSDKFQALARVYVDFSPNMWDEDFDKDEKAVAVYNRRMENK